MELKIKALSPKIGTEIPLPRFATAGAACMDLCACIDEAVTLLAEHPEADAVITHVVPADDAIRAFEVAKDSQNSGKVLVEVWGAQEA